MATTNVRIDGVKATIRALKEFEPDVEKALDYQIHESLDRVKTGAEARYSRGSWVVGRNRKRLLGYVAARAGGGKSKKSWGDGPAGRRSAIFEFIGKNYGGDTPQVVGLIKSLDERFGSPGRFLWDAWDEVGPRVLTEIEEAVRGAERELQARLDAAGEAY